MRTFQNVVVRSGASFRAAVSVIRRFQGMFEGEIIII